MECRFLYNKLDGNIFIKLIGDIKYSYSNQFNSFIDSIFEKNSSEDVIIDLTETNYIDSTNLGLLAKIARFQKKLNDKKVTIISDHQNITDILESMGFDMVFILIKSDDIGRVDYKDIASIPNEGDRETAKLMLDAHKELAELNEKNSNTFKDVVTYLQNELDK